MRHDARIAREISYASSAATRGGRAVIRAMENATGRIGLIRRARGYEVEVAHGRDFWEVMCERYGISLDIVGGCLDDIPASGPLVVVANHPYGILDGLMLGRILSLRRNGDFKVLAHRVFRRAPDLERIILPISFDESEEATRLNLATRAEARRYLADGGAIGIFPGGTVSTAARPMGMPLDPAWRTFTARLIARPETAVVPLFFDGHNSRLFQIASHVHYTLRMGMLIREFKARTGGPLRVVVGRPIPEAELARLRGEPKAMMDFLRAATYDLSPRPLGRAPGRAPLGHEFEDRHRSRDGGGHLR